MQQERKQLDADLVMTTSRMARAEGLYDEATEMRDQLIEEVNELRKKSWEFEVAAQTNGGQFKKMQEVQD